MSEDENGRPKRIFGDPKFVSSLIASNEAAAADMTDEQLEAEIEMCRRECNLRWPRIAQAQLDYQYPSQAFYVFDRTLNRRRLHAQLAAQE